MLSLLLSYMYSDAYIDTDGVILYMDAVYVCELCYNLVWEYIQAK